MIHWQLALSLAAALTVSACVAPPTGHESASEIFVGAGEEPTSAAAEAGVRAYLSHVLKDPESLKQFEILSGPHRITWYRGLMHGGGNEQGWLMCFRYNAKNSYGAYAGAKIDGVALRGQGAAYHVVPNVNWVLASSRC